MLRFEQRLTQFTNSHSLLLATSLLLLGIYVLAHDLTKHPMWWDEIWSASMVTADIDQIPYRIVQGAHPPLYYILLYISQFLFGNTTFGLRTLNTLLTVITISTLFRASKDFFDTKTAIVATILFIINDFVFRYAREVRMYMLAMLLVTLLIWSYYRLIQRPTRWRFVIFTIVGILAAYTHYFTIFTILGLGLHALIWHRRQFISFILMGITFLPWLPIWYIQLTDRTGAQSGQIIFWNVRTDINGFLQVNRVIFGYPKELWTILLFVPIWFYIKYPQHRHILSLLDITILVQYILPFGLNIFRDILAERYMFAVLPLGILLVAYTVSYSRFYIGLPLFGILILVALNTLHFGIRPTPNWEERAIPVLAYTDTEDVVLADSFWEVNLPITYYVKYGSNWQIEAYVLKDIQQDPKKWGYPANKFERVINEHDGAWLLVENTTENTHQEVFANFPNWQLTANFISPNFDFRMLRYDNTDRFTSVIMRYGDMQLWDVDTRIHNDSLTVNLVWNSSVEIEENFTVSVIILDKNGVLHQQNDSYPMNNTSPTSIWTPNKFYFDGHVLDLTDVPPGTYQVGLQVYHFINDNYSELELIQPDSCQPDCNYDFIAEIEFK